MNPGDLGAAPDTWALPRGFPRLDDREQRELVESYALGLLDHWGEATTTQLHDALTPDLEDDQEEVLRLERLRGWLDDLHEVNAIQADKGVRPNKWFSNGERASPQLQASVRAGMRHYDLVTWENGPLGTFVTVTEFKARPGGDPELTGKLFVDIADLRELGNKLLELADLAPTIDDADHPVRR